MQHVNAVPFRFESLATELKPTFVAKVGRGGRRGRRRLRRAEERSAGPEHVNLIHAHREISNRGFGTSSHLGPLFRSAHFFREPELKDVADVQAALDAETHMKAPKLTPKPVAAPSEISVKASMSGNVINTVITMPAGSAPFKYTLDLAQPWNETIAREAIRMWKDSGKSGRAFAKDHSFPENRLRSWSKRLGIES